MLSRFGAWLASGLVVVAFYAVWFVLERWDARRGPAILLALAALPFGALGVWQVARSLARLRRSRPAPGTVVRLEPLNTEGGGTLAPVVRFTDPDGAEREFKSDVASNPPDYQVGDPVTVLVPPGRPEDAVIRSFWSVWGLAVVFFVIGLVPFAIGLGWFYGLFAEGRHR